MSQLQHTCYLEPVLEHTRLGEAKQNINLNMGWLLISLEIELQEVILSFSCGYKSDFRKKISEALHIKELKPDLNVQKDAYRLKVFN